MFYDHMSTHICYNKAKARTDTPLCIQLSAERALAIELIAHPIYELLSAAALCRVASTCRTAHASVQSYIGVAFNVDRLLSRFFPSASPGCSATCPHDHTHTEEHVRARAFRSLQAATGTLISGSTALQFFDRTFWPESDLDLYVHARHRREVGRWLIAEGYRFKPTRFQDLFEVEIMECLAKRPDGIYSMPGVLAVFTFVKPLPGLGTPRRTPTPEPVEEGEVISLPDSSDTEEDEEPKELKVQVIVTKNTPMECILGFHSTCVMNVISYEKAYCLFPRATLEERRTLISSSCRGRSRHRAEGLAKYERRGYKLIYSLPMHEVVPDPAAQSLYPAYGHTRFPTHCNLPRARPHQTQNPTFRLGWRWIDDSASWVLGLPQTGVTPPAPANGSTRALAHDPVAVCNWEVRPNFGMGALMHFETVACKVLRYKYLVTDEQLLAYLGEAFAARGRVEDDKARLELEEWTYCDEELPTLCRDFLHGLATRRLSSLRL
ncbi:hypothetical protein BD310DRAFT_937845 [Dichomitus squalens]|uniref:Uncharacterized protein n=2 Tax=Dichomitus squalens TaxID=114155 RepID=A0A4Q9PII6_9APHY|nr:hypothetical protein BD310DRAFT_937845 [Dichomitus squalens]